MGLETKVTAEEFERMPEPEDAARLELDEGEVITMAPASEQHGDIAGEIYFRIKLYLQTNPLGKLYTAETGFRLSATTVRAPDVAFVRKERYDPKARAHFIDGAPDLAVEVVSPSDSASQLKRKVNQYLRTGCQAVWVVYPEDRTIHVFEPGQEERVLRPGDIIDAPAILPGFSAAVLDLFPE